jgi:hypothetical protein
VNSATSGVEVRGYGHHMLSLIQIAAYLEVKVEDFLRRPRRPPLLNIADKEVRDDRSRPRSCCARLRLLRRVSRIGE